jgi:phospholipase/carboxylesterase
MLGFDLSRPPGTTDGATVAVLLHGRGSHRGDLQALRPIIPADWVLVTPQAPHSGHPWGYGPGWAWYRYLAEDRVEDMGLKTSLTTLDALLAELPALLKLTPGRVIMGGFSQGGTVSLAHALTRPDAVAATMVFSGFLPATPLLEDGALARARTPIFWGHGTRDENVPFGLAERGRSRLLGVGAPLEARDYDIGHWIDPAEVADAVAFIDERTRADVP